MSIEDLTARILAFRDARDWAQAGDFYGRVRAGRGHSGVRSV